MFCVLQKKVLSFGPNRTVEVRPNSLAEPNVWSITNSLVTLRQYLSQYLTKLRLFSYVLINLTKFYLFGKSYVSQLKGRHKYWWLKQSLYYDFENWLICERVDRISIQRYCASLYKVKWIKLSKVNESGNKLSFFPSSFLYKYQDKCNKATAIKKF